MEIQPRPPVFSPSPSTAAERRESAAVASPSEEETLSALDQISRDGGRFQVEAAPLPSAPPASPLEVSAREFMEQASVAGAHCRVVLGPDKVSLPVSGVEDLAALTTLYAAGASTVAAAAHLLGSLRSMREAGVTFTAVDTKFVNDRGRTESRRAEVGPYGAWLAYREADASSRFVDVAVEVPGKGDERIALDTAEDAAAWAFFNADGPAQALGHPLAGNSLREIERAGGQFFLDENSWSTQAHGAHEAYLKLVGGEKDRVYLGRGTTRIAEVPLDRLDREPGLAGALGDRLQLFDRLMTVRKDPYSVNEALKALDTPVVGRTKAECEAAMAEVLRMSRGWAGRETTDFQGVVAAARDGESLVDVARELARVSEAFGGRESKDDLADAFAFHRTLAPEPAGRFLRLIERAQSHDVAKKTYDMLYADGRVERFAEREQSLESLFATEQKLADHRSSRDSSVFAGAVDAYDLVSRTQRAGEKFDEAVARYGDLVGRASRIDDAHVAFRVMREGLASPAGIPVREREDVFLSFFDGRRPASDAVDAYEALAAGNPSPEEFEARRGVLDHLLSSVTMSPGPGADPARGVRTLPDAVRDLGGLVDACAPYGGVQTADGKRFLEFADVSSTFVEARKAIDSLEHAPFPAEAAERDAIYLTVARAARDAKPVRSIHDMPTSTTCLDDYWYVVRTAAGGDGRPVAEQYARLLVAAAGEVSEARMAQAVVRTRLADAGPLGVPSERREEWLTRLLDATDTTIGAWEAMQWVEKARDAGEAEQRVRSLESLVSMAWRFTSAQPLDDAIAIYEDLASRPCPSGTPVSDVAVLLAEVSGRIPYGGNDASTLEKVRASLLEPGADLDTVRSDLRGLSAVLDRSRPAFDLVTTWPELRRVPAGVSHEDRAQAIQVLLGSERCSVGDLADVYHATAANAADGAALVANADVMARLLKKSGSRNAVEFYEAILDGLHPVAALGETVNAARMMRYADLVTEGADRESLERLLEMVRVPVAGEPLADREAMVTALWKLAPDGKASERCDETVESFRVLVSTVFPGERLAEVTALFEEVARAVRNGDTAREVIGRLQSERLQGSFPGEGLASLVERFVQAFAASGDVDRAVEILHRAPSETPVVVDGEEEVTVGGIRIPKRKGMDGSRCE